jgi:hypothetical protein
MFGLTLPRVTTRILSLAVLILGLAACQRAEPIYTVTNHPIPQVAQKLTLPEIEKTIMLAGAQRNWRFEPVKPGQLKARYTNGKHEAVVDVSYTQTAYSIGLNSTMNLRETDGSIHRTYNFWVRNLERDIEERLYKAGLEKG